MHLMESAVRSFLRQNLSFGPYAAFIFEPSAALSDDPKSLLLLFRMGQSDDHSGRGIAFVAAVKTLSR
jgi:hypothetical protein